VTTAGQQQTASPRAPERGKAVDRARVLHASHPGLTDPKPLGSLAVIVPTYNTSATVPAVVRALASAGDIVSQILIIDNASTDGTVEAVRAIVAAEPDAAAKVVVTSNPRNLGYGGSIKRGIEQARDFDLVAVIHSDDQCDAGATLRALVDGMRGAEVDVVLASRFAQGADLSSYSALRRLGNHFFNRVTRLVSGYPMSDAGTAIMLARTSVVADLPTARLTNGYRFHPQLNLLLYGDARLTIREVPLMWHDASLGNQFSLTVYGLRLLKMLTIFGWRRRVRGWSLHDAVVAAERAPD
jgi:dolichol-phosphate mannosyltransferase